MTWLILALIEMRRDKTGGGIGGGDGTIPFDFNCYVNISLAHSMRFFALHLCLWFIKRPQLWWIFHASHLHTHAQANGYWDAFLWYEIYHTFSVVSGAMLGLRYGFRSFTHIHTQRQTRERENIHPLACISIDTKFSNWWIYKQLVLEMVIVELSRAIRAPHAFIHSFLVFYCCFRCHSFISKKRRKNNRTTKKCICSFVVVLRF